ncbi:hypothetical protein ASPWEDRAFT_173073 [Aspergillus wentii DTO 134E9]|uniref:Amine oxidase n=1 Tax=Aspergillus wentii DTO 134E9 TaxID=1073089 RepID=A0A1L9RFF1_ASPWE|nr:uncharacterized protein ASPWEDRAFT_173073 [Aspergillus wentii DTO 134E9]OJJ33634.1 hypothetical protein ASPWEDRAFT_173073 [Aspergillus wentii DTO 134E9]
MQQNDAVSTSVRCTSSSTATPEANHYSLPAPFAPIFDANTLELIQIDRLPLGTGPDVESDTQPWEPAKPVEYSESLLGTGYFRKDLKPLQVVQPEGPSFRIDGHQITWQEWLFHLGWTVREGPVLNNIFYDGRSLFYRVSMSEMTVSYGDPRSPYHRKQTFELGDSCFGIGVRNSVVYDDLVSVRDEPDLDPFGCAFRVKTTPITRPGGYDLDTAKSRTYRIIKSAHVNAVSGKPVGYKLHALPSQMLMMGPETFNSRRGLFSTKPSREDTGLGVWVQRQEQIANEDVVLWHTFGVTHVTLPEDFPVTPVETMSVEADELLRVESIQRRATVEAEPEPVDVGGARECF